MDLDFANERLAKLCMTQRDLTRRFGPEGAKKIRARLDDLRDAACLADMRRLPGHCEALLHDRKGQLSVRAHQGYRIVLVPQEPVSQLPDGSLDWEATTAIRIEAIEDYHG